MPDFEYIEHTADFGIRVRADNIEELFTKAAGVLLSLLTKAKFARKTEKFIHLESQDLEGLLVIWLNELLSQFFADKFLPSGFDLAITSNNAKKQLKARVAGKSFDPYENIIIREIKAATYHGIRVEKTIKGYLAEVIFDV